MIRAARAPLLGCGVLLCLGLLMPAGAAAADPSPLPIGYLGQIVRQPAPASPLEIRADDQGVAGARLGLADNATTGSFTGQRFELKEEIVVDAAVLPDAVHRLEEAGVQFVVADLPAERLQNALRAASPGTVFLNIRARDDGLRNAECSRALLHIVPSRAMLGDALAQYLIAMGWRQWFLVVGRDPADQAYAADIRAAAKRFGAQIVAEKQWRFETGNPHADSGHVNLQAEIPGFTKGPDYDVLVVADEVDQFGEFLAYRTARPRPVAGTHGLIAAAWSPVQEQWGALQLQSRFQRLAHRPMSERDYTAWLAVRAIGEAAIRRPQADAAGLRAYMLSGEFRLAGFKGQPLSFRPWDGQLRQPVLIAGPRMLVSVSPQAQFLHQGSPLDSLGPDQSETQCVLQ